MRIRPVLAVSAGLAALTLALAPAASARGNYLPYASKTKLSNGNLFTEITPQYDGTGYWRMDEWYEKTGGGTITQQLGFNYHGYSYAKGWITQTSGTSRMQNFTDLGFTDCSDVVGWMQVDGQGTFYNAPVGIC